MPDAQSGVDVLGATHALRVNIILGRRRVLAGDSRHQQPACRVGGLSREEQESLCPWRRTDDAPSKQEIQRGEQADAQAWTQIRLGRVGCDRWRRR